ncbi:hypothetical protein FOFC_17624 [Fusarium oxysporum]|nr:hypothetical protein FOFC_17624 [Fusarium oxysporum]
MIVTAEETGTMANENRAAIVIRVAMVLMSLAVLVVGLRLVSSSDQVNGPGRYSCCHHLGKADLTYDLYLSFV